MEAPNTGAQPPGQARQQDDKTQSPSDALLETQIQLVGARVESVVHSLRAASSALEALAVPVRQLQAISRGARF